MVCDAGGGTTVGLLSFQMNSSKCPDCNRTCASWKWRKYRKKWLSWKVLAVLKVYCHFLLFVCEYALTVLPLSHCRWFCWHWWNVWGNCWGTVESPWSRTRRQGSIVSSPDYEGPVSSCEDSVWKPSCCFIEKYAIGHSKLEPANKSFPVSNIDLLLVLTVVLIFDQWSAQGNVWHADSKNYRTYWYRDCISGSASTRHTTGMYYRKLLHSMCMHTKKNIAVIYLSCRRPWLFDLRTRANCGALH